MEKTIISWSGGKDSAMALYEAQQSGQYDIRALLTNLSQEYGRVFMHGIRRQLLERQAECMGMLLEILELPKECSNEDYAARMQDVLNKYRSHGILNVVFGDIFLADLKKYREDKLSLVGMKAVFPIWKRDTGTLAMDFIKKGFRSVITCVDTEMLDADFAGRMFDEKFIQDLPGSVDPCGENGEFHSFVFDGPIFKRPVTFKVGERVLRDGRFNFCDLIP